MELLNQATALAALAVVGVQQLLKFKFVPVGFANRYPVPTLILLSIAASIVAAWQSGAVNPASWQDWLVLVVVVALSAALTYNQTLRNWSELRATEGEK